MKRIVLLVLAAALALACCAAGAEGSLLPAVYSSMDAAAGAHLNYTVSRKTGVTTSDAHAKAASYFCMSTTEAFGVTVQSGECFIGDTAYTLQPEKMQAIAAISTSSQLIKRNILQLDKLYQLIARQIGREDFTVETREVDGVSYTVEVYPGSDYLAEAAFYFDDTGRLAYILEGAPVIMPSLGEAFYTINAIDAAVDESLFDISAYTVTGL